MSYEIKYKFRAETVKYKDDVKINILEKDYAGASTDKYLGGGGVTLTKDNAGIICGTSLSFFIQADTDFEYIDFFEADPRKYLVQLLVNDVTVWEGYLIGDEYRESFRNPPYDVAVMATDGLGLLKNYTYTPLGDVDTKTNRIDVIDSILENTGLSLDVIVGYDVATTGGTNIFQVDFSDDYYSGWTCYEVLEKMIPQDATITQHRDQWLIRRNEIDSESTHVNFGNPYVGNDGKVYQTVKIGNQIWLAENLAETKFANGDAIPVVTGAEAWAALDTAGMCAYNNDDANVADYGNLYNWYAATDVKGIAASGWHVPTKDEFDTLISYLGGSSIAGGKLKETGTTYWNSPNTGADNSSGFYGRGSGQRSGLVGTFSAVRTKMHLYSVTFSGSYVYSYELQYNNAEIESALRIKLYGLSIRLIKDDSSGTEESGETPLSLARMGSGDIYPIGEAELNMRHAWQSMEFFSEHGKRPSFLQNHNFADGLTSWTEGPTTGYTTVYDSDLGSFVRMTGEHEQNSEQVPDVYISQSFPYVSVEDEGFALELKYCANGYVSIIGTGAIKKTDVTIKGRIKYTDGTTTLYLDETAGWQTSNRNFEHAQLGNIGPMVWNDFKIYTKNPPLASGTMTVYLYATIKEDYKTITDVNFTDIAIYPFIWQNYPESYRYDVALKENATETRSVTILPTSGPELDNYDRLFYNVHTASGARVDAFTSGGNTYTFPNLIINSLKFLHGQTRQLLSGYFRGSSLTLNSIISCAATSNRKYIIESGAWEVLNDKFKLDLIEIPGTADDSTWAMGTDDFSTSGEWSNNTTQGSASSETIGGGGGGISSAGGSWLDPYFELVNAGTSGEYIRALRDFASTGEITAYNAASPTGSFWDNMPFATTETKGVVIVDGTTITIEDGVISCTVTGGVGEGVTDHGALTGLADNDHPQYSLTGHNHVQYITGFSETDPIFTAVSGMFSTTGHTHNFITGFSETDPIFTAASGMFSTTGHNHSGTYEPAFSKNTGFNKNFGTTAGTVCQGNDIRLSDARTPTSHTHGSITNDGKIGSTANLPIITTTAGLLSAGSFGTDAGTFAEGNDSRFHTHANSANLNEINQDLGTGDDVHFLSADVTTLEVDTITDGIIQSGAGANLLLYSGTFNNANWTKSDVTLTTGQTSPFNAANAYYANAGSAGVIYQSISHATTGNYVFSIWIKAAGSLNVTLKLIADTSTLIAQSTASVTTAWQRFSVTGNFSGAHTAKRVQIETGSSDVYVFGAQLETGTTATRYTDTAGAAINAVGAYVYGNVNGAGDLRLSGDAFVNSLTAVDEVTAYSDQRLKCNISPVADLLDRLKKIEVVHYTLINDRTHRERTGIIAQQLLRHFPEMVEGSKEDYYSVNYSKLAVIAIKALQEVTARIENIEKRINDTHGK